MKSIKALNCQLKAFAELSPRNNNYNYWKSIKLVHSNRTRQQMRKILQKRSSLSTAWKIETENCTAKIMWKIYSNTNPLKMHFQAVLKQLQADSLPVAQLCCWKIYWKFISPLLKTFYFSIIFKISSRKKFAHENHK